MTKQQAIIEAARRAEESYRTVLVAFNPAGQSPGHDHRYVACYSIDLPAHATPILEIVPCVRQGQMEL